MLLLSTPVTVRAVVVRDNLEELYQKTKVAYLFTEGFISPSYGGHFVDFRAVRADTDREREDAVLSGARGAPLPALWQLPVLMDKPASPWLPP